MALIRDVDSILKGKKVKVRKAGEKFEHTSLLPDDEWYPKAVRTKIRPARWNWKDCYARLQEIASSPIPGADRRSSSSSTTTRKRWRARHPAR